MTELPDEIIYEILSRLPVKSLLRFKSVCKSWLSIISNPNFHHKTEYESILVKEKTKLENPTALIYLMDDSKAVIESSFSITCTEGKLRRFSNFCNGLVILCLGKSLFMFNPSTRYFAKVLSVPKSSKRLIVGLCYDTSINDYKVVLSNWRSRMGFVASLKTKRWAPIGFPSDYAAVSRGPIVNERMHWIVEYKEFDDNQSVYEKIIRYDLRTTVFEEFPSPPNGKANLIYCLGVLGGCICMARTDYGEFAEEKIEVLIMKEYDMRESWTTLFCFLWDFMPILITNNWEIFLKEGSYLNSRPSFPLTENGEVLIKRNVPGLFAYNLRKKTTREMDMLGDRNLWDTMSFVQNLASPPVGCELDEMLQKENMEGR